MKKRSTMKNLLMIMFLFLLLVGCDKDIVDRSEEDKRILDLAYNKDYVYPDGFYNKDGFGYYENTVSIKPVSEREPVWIELSTNDKNEALLWSNLSNEYSSVDREIISERENEKYFEFKRRNVKNERDIILSRVHKSSYFQPKLDKFLESDTVGIYRGELSETEFDELVEYLWSCGSMGLGHTKVIESQSKEYDDYFEQYIQSIKIIYGDFNINDYIYVYDNYFKMKKSDRTLIMETHKVKSIEGNEN
jgi:hypothetical protein